MPKYKINSGLPDSPASVSDKEYSLLAPVYRAVNVLAQRLSTLTCNVTYSQAELAALSQLKNLQEDNSNIVYPVAEVNLAYGQLVNIFLVSTSLTARLATNTPGSYLAAHAIVHNPSGATAGEYVACRIMQGHCAGVAGSAIGAQYWLGTAGGMQITKPTAAGTLQQQVAIGLGSAGVQLNIPNLGAVA
jgi:hypothetical protein